MQFDNLSSQEFLAHYWQRQWLYSPGGCAEFESPITADDLAGLALEEVVESRAVIVEADRYQLTHGPFDEAFFATERTMPWTLLVQAVDLWIPEVAQLYSHFDFLPRWRMDDIMCSFATPGAGVGPHYDYYDVFLVQAQGSRTWQIGQTCTADSTLVADADVKLLADFVPQAEITTQPGDVLYIPPMLAHWGVAETDSLTFSVGFRAPTVAELLDDLAMQAMATDHQQHLRDPDLTPAMATTDIATGFIKQAQALLQDLVEDEQALADWFARFVTNPKYPDLVQQSGELRRARINGHTYVNGELEA